MRDGNPRCEIRIATAGNKCHDGSQYLFKELKGCKLDGRVRGDAHYIRPIALEIAEPALVPLHLDKCGPYAALRFLHPAEIKPDKPSVLESETRMQV